MKALTLYPHEIRRLQVAGNVLVWRPIKPQPRWDTLGGLEAWRWECKGGHVHVWDEGRDPDEVAFVNQCAPHPPGSECWVRETWATDIHNNGDSPKRIAELCREAGYSVGPGYPAGPIWYQADGTFRRWGNYRDVRGRWRSPVTMPRWASRYTVQVAGVEARQVQTVTEDEVRDAGLLAVAPDPTTVHTAVSLKMTPPVYLFACWWERRYGASTWEANPWAWAYRVEVKEA